MHGDLVSLDARRRYTPVAPCCDEKKLFDGLVRASALGMELNVMMSLFLLDAYMRNP